MMRGRAILLLALLLMLTLAAATSAQQVEPPVRQTYESVLVAKSTEEYAQFLLQNGHSQEYVDEFVEFDREWEAAKRRGATTQELDEIIARSNATTSAQQGGQTAEPVRQTYESVLVARSAEEYAQFLLQNGHSQEYIDEFVEFDRQWEAAKRRGATTQELDEIVARFNERAASARSLGPVQSNSWSTHRVQISACCLNYRVQGQWDMPGYRDWESTFRATSGNYYRASDYCAYTSCHPYVTASGESSWDYHIAGVQDSTPTNHTAGCY